MMAWLSSSRGLMHFSHLLMFASGMLSVLLICSPCKRRKQDHQLMFSYLWSHWFLTPRLVGNKVQSAGPGKGSLQLSNASLLVSPRMRIGRFEHSLLGCTAVGDHGMLTRSGPTNSIRTTGTIARCVVHSLTAKFSPLFQKQHCESRCLRHQNCDCHLHNLGLPSFCSSDYMSWGTTNCNRSRHLLGLDETAFER